MSQERIVAEDREDRPASNGESVTGAPGSIDEAFGAADHWLLDDGTEEAVAGSIEPPADVDQGFFEGPGEAVGAILRSIWGFIRSTLGGFLES